MADNVDITAGTGTTVATDDVAGVHYQRVKLVDGTLDSTAAIAGDATNGLDVDVTRLPALVAGTANIGDVDIASPLGAGTEAAAVRVTVATDSTGLLSVDDNGGSLTVDNSTLAVVGGGVEATALRVTVASDSTGVVSVDDNGGSITVDNTNIDNLHSSDFDSGVGTDTTPSIGIAVAADGGAAVITGDVANGLDVDVTRLPALVAGSANIGDVDIASPLGAGTEAAAVRVTVATDSTGVLSVDDNAGSLTVDAPVATPVNVQVGDGTNTATIRNLAANDALNVAIVDGAGAQITTFGGGTQYTEADIDASITGTAVMWEDAADTLRAVSSAKPLPVNVVAGGGTGGTAIADESAFTEGTTNFTPVGGVLNDTIVSDPTEDQGAAFRITAKRGLHVNLRKNDGTEIASGGGAEANALLVTVANDSTGVVSVDDNGANLSVDWAGTAPPIGAGVEATALRVTVATDSTGVLSVDDNGGALTVDGTVAVSSITTAVVPGTAAADLGKAEDAIAGSGDTGVFVLAVSNEANTARAADGDYIAFATDTEGNSRVVGNRDHDAVDAGEVVKVGGVAVSGSATPTSVAAADRVRWIFNQHGIPYVLGGHPNLIVREFDFGTAAQTDLNLAAAVVAADERIYVTRFEALADNANSVAVSVRAGFGTASVPAASATGVSGMIASHPGLAAGSGIICGNGAGIIAVGGAGEEPRITTSAATGGNLHVIFGYFLVDETP